METRDPRPTVFRVLGFGCSADPGASSKYRALRSLAVDANDYVREMEFLANEIRSRRFWHDKPWGSGSGRFWMGLLYEKSSNFGRSVWRPILLWILLQGICSVYYFIAAILYRGGEIVQASKCNLLGEALFISISNSIMLGGVNSERLKVAEACLYGVVPPSAGLSGVPDFPIAGAIVCLLQTIASFVLFILFAISARGYFKIE